MASAFNCARALPSRRFSRPNTSTLPVSVGNEADHGTSPSGLCLQPPEPRWPLAIHGRFAPNDLVEIGLTPLPPLPFAPPIPMNPTPAPTSGSSRKLQTAFTLIQLGLVAALVVWGVLLKRDLSRAEEELAALQKRPAPTDNLQKENRTLRDRIEDLETQLIAAAARASAPASTPARAGVGGRDGTGSGWRPGRDGACAAGAREGVAGSRSRSPSSLKLADGGAPPVRDTAGTARYKPFGGGPRSAPRT
mgnify:CR=1 FL=1